MRWRIRRIGNGCAVKSTARSVSGRANKSARLGKGATLVTIIKKLCRSAWTLLPLILLMVAMSALPAAAGVADPVDVRGPQQLLVVAVRFPGTQPSLDLQHVTEKADRVDKYLRTISFGRAWLETQVAGWYEMPAPLGEYRVSPLNYKVDKKRVRRLVADAVAAAGRDVDVEKYRIVWVVVGARTQPGEGYGMIAYCANPGMLSGVRKQRSVLEKVDLPGGGSFSGPLIVSAENAHVGHVAHDLLHALGGARDGKRVVPDLYDFERQSKPPRGRMLPELFAIHTGPWDIMSQHFITWEKPPPHPSSFTRLQLGWIDPAQVATLRPGETREVKLNPLALGNGLLAVRVPIDAHRFLLIENRQPVKGDDILPSAGLLVLEVDMTREEGAGIVRVADANPGVPRLRAAPFAPGTGQLRYYRNADAGVAVAPLAVEPNGTLRLVVTTPERIMEFVPNERP